MSAKSKDTTKTAHVMNLLRKNTASAQVSEMSAPQEPKVEQSEPVAVQAKAAQPQHPIITSLNEEAAVSQEIKDALEQELVDREPPAAETTQVPRQEVVEEPTVVEKPLPVSVQEEPVEETKPVSEPVEDREDVKPVLEPTEDRETVEPASEVEEEMSADVVAEEQAAISVPPVAEEPHEKHIPTPNEEIYNVMQALVEESSERYMTMFNLCTCPRCKADVCALALNNLQPKYVVMGEGEYIPRITAYERRYHTTVTAQILRACTMVSENPRHDKKD